MLAALGAAALWGTTGTAQALGPGGTDPVSVGALRIAVGALALGLLAARSVPRRTPGTDQRLLGAGPGRLPAGAVLLLGGLCVATYQACFFLGVDRAGVAVGTVVALGVAPLATGALGLLLGERLTRRWSAATAGAVVGIILLVLGAGSSGAGVDPLGVAGAVGAGLSYAGYTVAARTLLLRGAHGVAVMAGTFGVGALVMLPALAGADLGWVLTAHGALMVAWLGLVATALSYVLFQHSLAGLPSSTVATLSLAEPVTATLLGVLVLGEVLAHLSAVGVAVVVLSLAAMALPGRRSRVGTRVDA